jgi:cytoskeletal protein CcmA (bactofilin family)
MLSSFTTKKAEKDTMPSAAATPSPSAPPMLPNSPISAVRPAAAARSGDRTPSFIGPDLTIVGNLVSKGEMQVEGEVQGDLHGTQVVVGERAKITGGIIAEEVVVRGHVLGSIRGRRVMLQASSHVEGDVHHTTLAIEQGAFFEGKSRRSDDPIAGVPAPNGADGLPVPRLGS